MELKSKKRTFLLLFGLMAVAFVIMNLWEMPQRVKQEATSASVPEASPTPVPPASTPKRPPTVQEQRKEQLREACGGSNSLTFDYMTNDLLEHMIVDDKHHLIYCYIPKVACTNLKRIMLVLGQGRPYRDPSAIPPEETLTSKNLTFLIDCPPHEIKAKLESYTKFLFVRDPLVRLISAYRDKFLRVNPYFYKISKFIMQHYGNMTDLPDTPEEAYKAGMFPSFLNFIQYRLDPNTERDKPLDHHWKQMYRLCQPCNVPYDFIGHQETIEDDIVQLLKMLNLSDDMKLPHAFDHVTDYDYVYDYYRKLPQEYMRKVLKAYELDFKIFGYRRPDELLQD